MPRKKRSLRQNISRVIATEHAEMRWEERARKSKKKLNRLMTSVFNEQLRVGVRVLNGQLLLNLSAERLHLAKDLVVPLAMADNGVWHALTVKHRERGKVKFDRESKDIT